jgi:hypothetical protein
LCCFLPFSFSFLDPFFCLLRFYPLALFRSFISPPFFKVLVLPFGGLVLY